MRNAYVVNSLRKYEPGARDARRITSKLFVLANFLEAMSTTKKKKRMKYKVKYLQSIV